MNLGQLRGKSITRQAAGEEFSGRFLWRRTAPEALDPATIADLSDSTIADMNREELVRMICAADLPLPSGFDADRLRLQDQSTLERLAYLARRACRNQLAILSCCCGGDAP